MAQIGPVTLTGQHVTLVPLTPDHHDGLVEAAGDSELCRLWFTTNPSPDGLRAEIPAPEPAGPGGMLPFTVLDRSLARIAGMTTYMGIDREGPRVEIGSHLIPISRFAHRYRAPGWRAAARKATTHTKSAARLAGMTWQLQKPRIAAASHAPKVPTANET